MPVVILRIQENIHQGEPRPAECPRCGSEILQRWGMVARSVKDMGQSVAYVYRYHCSECNYTFRIYPSGLDRSHISQRVRKIAALAWALGMSSREVRSFFEQFDIQLSHATIWRDGQGLLKQLGEHADANPPARYCLDSRFLPGVSNRLGVVIAIDLRNGRLSVLGTVDEYNPRMVILKLKRLVGDGIEVLTTETKGLMLALEQVSPQGES